MQLPDADALAGMSLREMYEAIEAAYTYRRFNKMEFFEPVPKQREFIAMSAEKNELCLFAGNRLGKTECGAYIASCHATGRYPKDWPGRKWDRPTMGWACGQSNTKVRDVPQAKLFGKPGDPEDLGAGFVPKDAILRAIPSHGVSNGYDYVDIRHVSGGVSRIAMKSYEMGRGKFQSDELDWIWFDEEPEGADAMGIYSEGRTRRAGTGGLSWMTFTPLGGKTEIVCLFLEQPATWRGFIQYGIHDATFLSPELQAQMLKEYPEHERQARAYGDPLLGSGLVFTTPWTALQWKRPVSIPSWWRRIWGLDFGIGHPFAAVLLAWDPESSRPQVQGFDPNSPYQPIHQLGKHEPLPGTDHIYVLYCVRMEGQTPPIHATAMKRVGAAVKVAWPHDGADREKGSGEALQISYRREGLLMLPEHATHVGGGYSTEAGIDEMDTYMREGRFHVADDLTQWFEEYRGYHRKDGQIVKVRDDLMSATRIGMMSRRFATTAPLGGGEVLREMRANRPTQAPPTDPFTNRPVYG